MLDEPSMGLAPMVISQIFAIIADINAQGTTVLLVEQNAQQALSRSDRAYMPARILNDSPCGTSSSRLSATERRQISPFLVVIL